MSTRGRPPDESRIVSTPGALAAAVLLAGIAGRLTVYFSNRAVTYDECLLWLALHGWSPKAWLTPLGFEQTAAPLYLALLHVAAGVGAAGQRTLRLWPCVASVLILPIFYWAVKPLQRVRTALIATSILALHATLIDYAGIFKPYGTDALLAAMIFGLAALIMRRYSHPGTWPAVLLGGVAGLLISQTAALTLACLVAWAFARTFSPTGKTGHPLYTRRWIVLCSLAWVAAESVLYHRLYVRVAASPYMQAFWADSYLSPGAPRTWANAAQSLFEGLPGGAAIGGLAALVGIVAMLFAGEAVSLILVAGPILSAVLLAMLHIYPVAPRLWLFLSPAVAVLAARGVEWIWSVIVCPSHRRSAAVAAMLVLAAGAAVVLRAHDRRQLLDSALPAFEVVREASNPRGAEQQQSAVQALLQDKSCEPIYIAARGAPHWYFYSGIEPAVRIDRYPFLSSAMRRDSAMFGDATPAALHLPDPAPQLTLPNGCRREIYGLASGTPFRNGLREEGRAPVQGWAKNEIDRLSIAGPSGFLLYLEGTGTFESRALLDELAKRRLRYKRFHAPLRIYRVQKD
jgi:hypothetical protein